MTNKPIGCYCNFTTGDMSLMDILEQEYGSHIEKMSCADRLYLVDTISSELWTNEPNYPSPKLESIVFKHESLNLTKAEQLALLEFLIVQIRNMPETNEQTAT